MNYLITIIAIALAGQSCKLTNDKSGTSSVEMCSTKELATLEAELATIRNAEQASAGGSEKIGSRDQILSVYSANHTLATHTLEKILDSAPYSDWQTELFDHCQNYGRMIARNRCTNDSACKSFFGFGSVDERSAAFQQYQQKARQECEGHASRFVSNRTKSSKPSTQNTVDDVPVIIDANAADRIAALERRIAECKTNIDDAELAAMPAAQRLCISFPELTWDSKIGVCRCQKNPDVRSANEWSIANVVQPKCAETPDEQAAAATQSTPTAAQVAPEDTDSNKPESCTCKVDGNMCTKVVGGKVVASLTVIQNNNIGQQEVCDPSGAGGYENLCNQPQLKCQ